MYKVCTWRSFKEHIIILVKNFLKCNADFEE